MTTQTRPRMTDEPGVRFGIANGLLVVALIAAAVSRFSSTETEVAVVFVGGLAACGLSPMMTTWIGVIAWALFTGFVENSYGQLTFGAGDLQRLAVLTIATVAIATIVRRHQLRHQGERA
jgi:hypothetical protein